MIYDGPHDIGGLKFYLRGRDEGVVRAGVETNVYEFPDDLTGKTVVDIGAFVGGIANMCAKRGATVYSAEPSRDNYKLLTKNIALNGFEDRIHAQRVALGKHKAKTRLIDIGDNKASNVLRGLENTVGDLDRTERVTIRNLKEFFQDNNIEHCDYLKLDCEGAEIELLDDIVDLHEKIDCIVAELHSRNIESEFIRRLTMFNKEDTAHREVRFRHKSSTS